MTQATTPMVSVVVPCHNATAYLRATLDGILTQTGPSLEVVLVDDGSSDDPAAIVSACGDERIRFLRQPASGGPSRPRNKAIAVARGRYVAFCDADDVMLPGKLEQQVALLEGHPRLGMVFTNFQVIDAAGGLLEASFLANYETLWKIVDQGVGPDGELGREQLVLGLLTANFVGTSSVVVRRSVLDDVGGFDESLVSSEDLELWLRIARRYPCAYLDLIGHGYRRRADSLMQEDSPRHPLARIEVMRRQQVLPSGPAERRVIRYWLSFNHRVLAYILGRNGDLAGARKHYLESYRIQPNVLAAVGWFKAATVKRLSQGLRSTHRG